MNNKMKRVSNFRKKTEIQTKDSLGQLELRLSFN